MAVITEATLKLHGIPKVSYAMRVSFPSVRDAAAAARDMLNCGVSVGRCELLDDTMVSIINATNPTMSPWPVKNTLMVELTGPSVASVLEQLEIVKGVSVTNQGYDVTYATDEKETKRLWTLRKQVTYKRILSIQ